MDSPLLYISEHMARNRQLNVRLSERADDLLAQMAADLGMSKTAVVELAVKHLTETIAAGKPVYMAFPKGGPPSPPPSPQGGGDGPA